MYTVMNEENFRLFKLLEKFCIDRHNYYSTMTIYNLLRRGHIDTIEDFKNATDEDILKIHGVGVKKLEFIMNIKKNIV